jgi:phage tail-like protein
MDHNVVKFTPALKHSFKVTLQDVADDKDMEYFYAIEGLGLMYQVDNYSPGGYGSSYSMPIMYEVDKLVLKRPLAQEKSKISTWCQEALDTGIFKPTIAHIFILNVDDSINNHWTAERVYPIGIRLSPLDLESGNPIIIETITLAYSKLNRINVSAASGR